MESSDLRLDLILVDRHAGIARLFSVTGVRALYHLALSSGVSARK